MKLADFKGEEAFRVMGRVVSVLKKMFSDEKATKIILEKKEGYLMTFFEYSLDKQAAQWLDMFVTLNPGIKREDVTPMDVVSFAYEFMQDEQMMSLFFSSGRTMTQKTSIGSAMASTEVSEK